MRAAGPEGGQREASLGRDRHAQKHEPCAERVGECHGNGAERESLCGGDGRDGRDHRTLRTA